MPPVGQQRYCRRRVQFFLNESCTLTTSCIKAAKCPTDRDAAKDAAAAKSRLTHQHVSRVAISDEKSLVWKRKTETFSLLA